MRALLIGLVILLPLISACTGGGERDHVYAEAKKCAEQISKGGACSGPQAPNGNAQPGGQGQNNQPTAKSERREGESAEESRVYIDATESMKGFASPNSTFTRVLDSLSYAMPGCRLYKYGIRRGTQNAGAEAQLVSETTFSQELRRPSFYDRAYNEDDLLFEQLVQEERPVRSVFVTDGVYSARQSELQSSVVTALDDWMRKGRFFGILIFHSEFEGNLYSENRRGWLEKVSVSDRPFYAFVFSPNEAGFRELKEKLSAEFDDVQSLVFPPQAIICQLHPQPKNGLIYKDAWPASPYYLQMYDGSLFGDKNSAELTCEFQCRPAQDYPVAEFGLDVTLEAYGWQQDTFKKSPNPPPFSHEYPANPGGFKSNRASAQATPDASHSPAPGASSTPEPGESPKLKLTFQKDKGTSYSLYHPIFTLTVKALRPGIRSRSTEDDGERADADKTYRFYEFISALTTAHLRNKEAIKLPPELFIAIANK